MEDARVQYLQMIQEPICRMSTISAVIKGFSVTIGVGILTEAFEKSLTILVMIAALFIVVLMFLDIYYLKLEKRYRYLFEQVRTGKHPIDFSMELSSKPLDRTSAGSTTFDCFLSPSIYGFYIPTFVILVVFYFFI